MTRSPDSLVPSASGQPDPEKRDDKALTCWQEGEANLRAATEVNAVSASSYPPAITPIQLEFFPGRACPLGAKPATDRNAARVSPVRRRHLRPVGKRIRAKPESAATTPSRESEVAVLPMNLGKTEGREGPLLPSFVHCWERQPDCPRKGRLHPGPIEPSARRPRD